MIVFCRFSVMAGIRAKGGGVDWNAVSRAIGRPLETEAGVHTAEWLRTDLHVVNAPSPSPPT